MQMISEPMRIESAAPIQLEYSTEPVKIQYPMAKTFIQYPALRSQSLEAFFQERGTSSCPASRMPSIDEDDEPCMPNARSDSLSATHSSAIANEIKYTVKNTFIDNPAWESLRNPSLEGFFQERQLKSCPVSRMQSLDDSQEGLTTGAQERTWDLECQGLKSLSLEECLRDIEAKYQDLEVYDDISTKANTDEDTAPPTPQILSDSEDETKPCAISLTSGLGLWSVGSAEHSSGMCKPCAFLWKDASGCQNGTNCKFCHMCTPGEVKRRKKQKLAMQKMVRQFQQPQAFQQAGYYGRR